MNARRMIRGRPTETKSPRSGRRKSELAGANGNGKRSYVRASGVDQRDWSVGDTNEAEGEDDSHEPSLGWTACVKQGGTNWLGGTDDAEHEHDGWENEDEAVGRRAAAFCANQSETIETDFRI